jgi:hypothetical protein
MRGAINDAIREVIKEVIREAIREAASEPPDEGRNQGDEVPQRQSASGRDVDLKRWISRLDLEIGSREVAHSSSIIIRHHHVSLPRRNWDVCCHPTRRHRSPRSELAMVHSRPW